MSAYPCRKDRPDEADIVRAKYSLFEGKVMDINGYLTESFSEAPDDKKLRIAQAVLAQDPTEIGQVFLDLVDSYCKVSREDAYMEAMRVLEYGEMDKAATVLAVNEANRRGLEAGRRESDREREVLRDNLRLACNLLSKAIQMAEGGEFTEQDMTALKLGLEVLHGC